MAMPAPVQELWNVWREIEGGAARNALVNLYGPPGDLRDGLSQMMLLNSRRPGALHVRALDEAAPPDADVHLVLVDAHFGPSSNQLTTLRRLEPKAVVLLLVGVDEPQLESRRREVATAVGVRLEQVLAARTLGALRPLLAKRLVAQFTDLVVALARQFPFMREEAAQGEVQASAQQNAMIGLVPVAGADMPLMTANQAKMVLRIASLYDQTLSAERAKELLVVIGGGFAFRSLARQVVKLVPGAGWAIGSAMGYGGTLAMGKAAIEYFRRVTEPSPSRPAPQPAAPSATVLEAEVVEATEESSR